ncbi:helix-turn-helix domain-containing protein [Chitinophaga sp.]|uniref:winged helix-turn-helix transcriptional regulator n=1 Tax=Chitinophaga sp. TaxID=1869181 RepID=UPI002F9336B2
MLNVNNCERSPEACTASLTSVGDALYAIGGKWKLKIIVGLIGHRRRFNELQRIVTGISAKVLSNELKEMELNGFVRRIPVEDANHIMEYELTDYSDTLSDVLHALTTWGKMHRQKITGRSMDIPAPQPASVE